MWREYEGPWGKGGKGGHYPDLFETHDTPSHPMSTLSRREKPPRLFSVIPQWNRLVYRPCGSSYPLLKKSARSKNGCMTCSRRKVRCNETRPIYYHCLRLHLECKWRPTKPTNGVSNTPGVSRVGGNDNVNSRAFLDVTPLSASTPCTQESFDGVFNYASFLWDGPEIPKSSPWESRDLTMTDPAVPNAIMTWPFPGNPSIQIGNIFESAFDSGYSDGYPVPEHNHAHSSIPSDDRALLDYFVQSVVPPIIAQVETQSKWASMRQTFMFMSRSSPMLRHALLTFSSLLMSRQGDALANTNQKHYAQTVAELAKLDEAGQKEIPGRAALFATLFFLSYTNLLDGRCELAHAGLNKAFDIYQSSSKTQFTAVEVRLLLWIRLIDARAVSAGGQGLFLSEIDEKLLVSSPPDLDDSDLGIDKQPEADVEEVLFDILYQPGIIFFQKVQSFMGRISHQDPWHRTRGTVEDETEVMSIASEISKDLGQLYQASRPPLMDHAAAGLLEAPHISSNLALTITKAFRTFLSNYHASKIHLHRVAYKSLPLTKETIESIDTVRNLAKLLVDGDTQDILPVNMLWPLVMWGSEEKNPDEREWIKSQILRMEKVATNARMTSQVLEEVQKRQDALNARKDIREVMEQVFNNTWAIV